ncbi:hypothetical protein ACFSGI_02695 [Paenibacillus nicotianae]|uniref:Lactococcin 972 family bacteriocin n=1 Tax=Paenibacillus nicotianae TaxID=1526551 RepID=A0ABW4URM6_9BACL
MKKQKKVFYSCILGISLLSVAVPSFASTSNTVSGGWSESKGYYVNSSNVPSITIASSTSPDSHTGKRITNNYGSSASPVFEYAAYGKTVWKNVDHYTTAQIENSNNVVRTTSGRKYNNSNWISEATSPYYIPGLVENIEARTYWGKK